MPQVKNGSTSPVYFVAHGLSDVVHYGRVESSSTLVTGQPNLEQFEDSASMAKRALELDSNVFEAWSPSNALSFSEGDFCLHESALYEVQEELTESLPPSNIESGWVKVS